MSKNVKKERFETNFVLKAPVIIVFPGMIFSTFILAASVTSL